jgi:hypothetical protein
MQSHIRVAAGIVVASGLAAAAPAIASQSEGTAIMHARGRFEVKIQPQQPDNPQAQAAGLGRLSLDKQFHGALDARSQGEMLSSGDQATGSGAYVAIEKIDGALDGRRGSFVLVHRAVMDKGTPGNWSVDVVPDSGTGALAGLRGSMTITITGGEHFYEFEYTLSSGG